MSIQETIEIRVSNKLIILRLYNKRHGNFPCLLVVYKLPAMPVVKKALAL